MESLIEVKLLGELGRRFGRSYSFVASSPKEIISALSNQIEGFKDYLREAHENGIGFRLVDGDAEGMAYEEVAMGCKQLIIAPIVTGGGAIGRVLLGVALIALAFIPGFGTAIAAGAAKASFTFVGGLFFNLGVSLVLTGIASLLTPPVEQPRETERKDSFLFDRATELTTQGQPVPLLYGKFLAASPLIISSAITTQQVPV
jgi:predicted phage tail protein